MKVNGIYILESMSVVSTGNLVAALKERKSLKKLRSVTTCHAAFVWEKSEIKVGVYFSQITF